MTELPRPLCQNEPGCHAALVGDGPEDQRIEQEAGGDGGSGCYRTCAACGSFSRSSHASNQRSRCCIGDKAQLVREANCLLRMGWRDNFQRYRALFPDTVGRDFMGDIRADHIEGNTSLLHRTQALVDLFGQWKLPGRYQRILFSRNDNDIGEAPVNQLGACEQGILSKGLNLYSMLAAGAFY